MISDDCRAPFRSAARAFCALVDGIRPEQWTTPALGTWDVRGLVGHTSRALTTVEAYLAPTPAGPASRATAGAVLTDPVEYFMAVLADTADDQARARQHAGIAERGHKAGQELGEHPSVAVHELADRVVGVVEKTPDDAILTTPAGPMTLSGYLPTRTFELVVHSLDLARAIHVPPPSALGAGVVLSCELAGRLAARRREAADLLLLFTGRSGASGASLL